MVRAQIRARGIEDEAVLNAMRTVPREEFVPAHLRDFAYNDSALPIEADQTISQPLIVAEMLAALEVGEDDRVLDVGTGSGYAAAVLSRMVAEVFSVERHEELVEIARARFRRLGYRNIAVLFSDGTLGWPEHAPYDGIQVAAAGPDVPLALREQLAIGAHLVIPVGAKPRLQELVRVTRTGENEYGRKRLGAVQFVPLVGVEGWADDGVAAREAERAPTRPTAEAAEEELDIMTAGAAEPFGAIDEANLEPLLDRIGDSRVVLLGEATHGTAEFYRMRAKITRALIERSGFRIVAVEADWPDAARIDTYVRGLRTSPADWQAFSRFPSWMWRNREVRQFVDWLHTYNQQLNDPSAMTGFFGIDLYSLYTSIASVLDYLEEVDPDAAAIARDRYRCLTPWEGDPAAYGAAATHGGYVGCEEDVVATLTNMLESRLEYQYADGRRFLDAVQNARLVANAESYYRLMYHGSRESWNLRDRHMFDTLRALMDFEGPEARAVVWAHNSHIGDATATEMGRRGEHNIGQLCRHEFGSDAYLVGFGTDRGTVAAASNWDAPMEVMEVRPSHPGSYERICHDSGVERFMLDLRRDRPVRAALSTVRLERAIGVIYRPRTERASHYFEAALPRQFDEYIWFDETAAVEPLDTTEMKGMEDTYPFGL